MKKKINTPNYELILKSAIGSLKYTYEQYKKACYEIPRWTFINDEGEFCVLAGYEEREAKVDAFKQELMRLKIQIEEIRMKIYEMRVEE